MIGHLSQKASAAAVAALAVAGSLMVPGVVSAQTYGYGYPPAYGYNSGYGQGYDPCVRDQRDRTTTGGVVGATIGAIAGSQLAARGRRTEGSVLGGVLGAALGAGVGNNSAACDSRYRSSGYDQSYGRTYVPPAYGYDNRRYDDGYGRDYREYSNGYDRGYTQPAPDYRHQNTDECRLAESVIRLPDGRSETRYVRTCPDQDGRYRVVD
ncbi:glycine zipper 2TM domain-containing protein [Brevundimonas sp.]|uniref:glycine zipper 2TM domain-containing protein n=1 Tax=Brevundimonas sp. TaxID=1871086 RepID=UPI002ED9B355